MNPNPNLPPNAAETQHVVEGEMTLTVRIIGLLIAGMVALAVALGIWRGLVSPATGKAAIVDGLMISEVIFAAALIMLGSIVEGFGYGLSLGTKWPYTRNIVVLMLRGDPEAAHRVLATAVGLCALALVILDPRYTTFMGLGLIIITALFGMGTLYVLAGRAPAFVHGTHGLLAYLVFLNYLLGLNYPGTELLPYIDDTVALHSILFAIFMGGMVTGQRGFGTAIEPFLHPQRTSQWIFMVHGLAALIVIGTLGWFSPFYPVAFALALLQAAVGFFLFHAVNLKPKSPGVMVVFHQVMALLITSGVVLMWHW
ncbi:cytochrome C oxidase assembly protein [Acidihalobacter ferrooxydans]|uniref:Cytochrome C oxidase assembly protein n=1 Tax=Acidihalobacter ferrooxydans TaxID=1765967 RepID=A0A1P8UG57_9GAMM|nr:cytochrome C oxidase assembly protein [Acidihalobacter ferrooxydans]APZ42837.1 cytochrome C oxidase assembly protein [Acidihalobacter ferrooxydans]